MQAALWILVVGPAGVLNRPDGAVSTLRDLGCRIQTADLWDPLDEETLIEDPPTAVIVEAMDQVDAGRAALMRIRASAPLMEVPVLIGLTVNALSRLSERDAFDDFVLVPYVAPELYLRIRRSEWKRSDFSQPEQIKIGRLCIDLAGHEVTLDDVPVELTQQEFALLRFMAQNRGRVYSRQQLLELVWGVDYYGGSRTVDIHVRRLRMKLGSGIDALQTVRGVGYKMKEP